ncbi:phosphonate ABC transporter ATP-binding protein [Alkalispirochaeta americana]|uniref:phosphonate ABC transporter ATP-binding protein n=1 Tax=Alkalispirochaeta americana TaxID=159291 RepID=UPI00190ED70C|nr:phosphonate ABC transporter ATP-binding protein [Alkalispirochaeta americana]
MAAIVTLENVTVTYAAGSVKALKNFNITINPGEFVVVVGLSGAGKSTMLRCVNRLVTPTDGKVYIDGKDITGANGTALKRLRREVGMIFQNFNLVKRSPVLRNVLAGRVSYVPTWRTLLGLFPKADREIALDCLQRVGIPEKAAVRADALSGGQQQRVGIARALAQKPKIILADEPVASLDPPTSHAVMRDLKRINREDNITTLVNLHFIDMALEYADRIIGLRDGELVFDGSTSEATSDVFEEIYGRPITDDDVIGEDSDAASF